MFTSHNKNQDVKICILINKYVFEKADLILLLSLVSAIRHPDINFISGFFENFQPEEKSFWSSRTVKSGQIL
jgi:hypothetical protein